jgi:hypothetical protein
VLDRARRLLRHLARQAARAAPTTSSCCSAHHGVRDPIRLRRPARDRLGSMRRCSSTGCWPRELRATGGSGRGRGERSRDQRDRARVRRGRRLVRARRRNDRRHLDGRRARQRHVAAEGARRGRAGAGSDRPADGRVPGAPRRPRHRGVDAPRHRAGTLVVMCGCGA